MEVSNIRKEKRDVLHNRRLCFLRECWVETIEGSPREYTKQSLIHYRTERPTRLNMMRNFDTAAFNG